MVEPLACCLHGVDAAGVVPGDTVAVIGLGPIGLMLCACIADAGGHPIGVGSRAERFVPLTEGAMICLRTSLPITHWKSRTIAG